MMKIVQLQSQVSAPKHREVKPLVAFRVNKLRANITIYVKRIITMNFTNTL